MRVLVASDLDRTLIYSKSASSLGPAFDLQCVEVYNGDEISFVTRRSLTLLRELARNVTFVPATTRTVEQLARVTLPIPAQGYAIAANGGVILQAGAPDVAWSKQVARNLAEALPVETMWGYLTEVCRPEWVLKLRNAQDLFCYAVLDRAAVPPAFLAETSAWAADRGWRTSLQGRKLYWVPAGLTKSAAVAEVADRVGAEIVVAAGDSLLDIDMLTAADRAIRPAHGELFEQGWTADHVVQTAASGAMAGEQILEWFACTAFAEETISRIGA